MRAVGVGSAWALPSKLAARVAAQADDMAILQIEQSGGIRFWEAQFFDLLIFITLSSVRRFEPVFDRRIVDIDLVLPDVIRPGQRIDETLAIDGALRVRIWPIHILLALLWLVVRDGPTRRGMWALLRARR